MLQGRPVADGVFVNGHGPYRFLIDTGSNVNLIESALAEKLGMTASFQVVLASAAGSTPLPGTGGHQIQLGPTTAENQKLLLSDLSALHRLSPQIRGVLGQWFLSSFDYLLDFHARQLEFGKQDRSGPRSPFRMINARPVVATSLGALALDSGASRLVLFGVRPDPDDAPPAELRTLSGSQPAGLVSGRPLLIAGRKISHGDAVSLPRRTEAEVDGLMPLSLFKTIYVCNSESFVQFQ